MLGRDIRVFRPGGPHPHVNFLQMPLRSRAAIIDVDRSPSFAQGQALFAGGFIDRPSLVQMGARYTHEGGVDVRVPLR